MDYQSQNELGRLNEELAGIASRLEVVERLDTLRSTINAHSHKTPSIYASRKDHEALQETVDELLDGFRALCKKVKLIEKTVGEIYEMVTLED